MYRGLILLSLVLLVVGGIFYFRDTTPPLAVLTPSDGPISPKSNLRIELKDDGAGLKSLSVSLKQDDTTIPLLTKNYPPETRSATETISLEGTTVKDGEAAVVITAIDSSPYHLGSGNTVEQSFSFDIDSHPPLVSVLSRAHNLNQGGAGLTIYDLSEEPSRTGVIVGEHFFPAHLLPSGKYAVLFAFPYDMKPADFLPQIVAVDRAGNERIAGFYYHTNPRSFASGRIDITDSFLNARMPPFRNLFPEAGPLLDVFLKVNRDLRASNRATLAELSAITSDTPLWDGAFLRLPNSANRENFATRRTYLYAAREIDRQTHLGVDLASVAQGPVVAANNGTVVYADDLGIYGQCIVIDHGLGLQSLYGHLSKIGVSKGEEVRKGQEIGRTGATGLAGGDHLHFGILISGVPVNPVEWWDPSWVENNITSKLR